MRTRTGPVGVTAALLVAGGLLLLVSEHRRWAAECPWWGAPSDRCWQLQNGSYTADAAPLVQRVMQDAWAWGAASSVVLAVAFLLLPQVVGRPRPGRAEIGFGLLLGSVFAALAVAQAVPALLGADDPLAGGAVQRVLDAIGWLGWTWAVPAGLFGLFILRFADVDEYPRVRQPGWWQLAGPLLIYGAGALSSPLASYLVMSVVHPSVDTPPWTLAWSALTLVIAGLLVAPLRPEPLAAAEEESEDVGAPA